MRWLWLTVVLILALVGSSAWVSYSMGADIPKAPNLQAQWLVVMLVLLGFCIAAGYAVNGRPDGIFIDDRNRVSLSRLQWVLWFVVLVSAFFVGTMLNLASGLADPFPVMQMELFGLIGLASGSAVLSNVIVDAKKRNSGVADVVPQAAAPGNVGKIAVKAEVREASWADLYCGEEVGNRATVDVSRMQQFITTLMLIFVYIGFIWRDLDTAGFTGSLEQMPAVSAAFLGLLAASHAGYQLYKAAPKT